MSAEITQRNKLITQLKLLLGNQMVDVELDNEHYNLAIDIALETLMQKSDGGLIEDMLFITMQPEKQEYTLPSNVIEVKKLYRRGTGHTGAGVNFDPFTASTTNMFFYSSGKGTDLLTWEAYSQYKETVNRLFGGEINFVWDGSTKKLSLVRKPLTANEPVLAVVWVSKPEDDTLTHTYTGPWCRNYALAYCKKMLGEARGKYPGGLPGPAGAVVLNGDQLKQEAQGELEALEYELKHNITSAYGTPFIIG